MSYCDFCSMPLDCLARRHTCIRRSLRGHSPALRIFPTSKSCRRQRCEKKSNTDKSPERFLLRVPRQLHLAGLGFQILREVWVVWVFVVCGER